MDSPISLIVGLGNPGAEYAETRHNAGIWFVEDLANHYNTALRFESKFQARVARVSHKQQECHLLIPETFMNLSGQAVAAFASYYKIPSQQILVAHDELDLPVGAVRLKFNGGHGGHNGLRDIMAKLSKREFHRLRIGIGHPGDAKHVVDYVLKRPSAADKAAIEQAIVSVEPIIDDLLAGYIQKAMKALHTQK